ncbi:shikimate kinase [Pilibacter termitis]|uniref:Shikimate kinase n=1 Tax=Pilibacter termitis TaxID=263852 RepID=A0A1T4MRC3_9ENTE|nr:shikimate kinase [Pilibacter termitis]SJZ69377.1 shikimate kinase [Pilibacter termitis]
MILIGFMGSGKTTVGRILAEKLAIPQFDLDEKLVENLEMSISEYFALHGENAFRQKESELLAKYSHAQAVISTGGGIVLREENRKLLKNRKDVIFLSTDTNELISRLQNDKKNIRPLAQDKTPEEIQALLEGRLPFYEESASVIIETKNKTPEEIAEEILFQKNEIYEEVNK